MSGGVYAFGKMPSVGDFFRLGAPQDFVAAWDPWVQSAMLGGQTALGPDWDTHYMSAPIWRFTLCPGLAGARAWTGIVMPSVDRVGRRFPLTLLSQLDAPDAAACHFANDAFFDRVEDLALAALEDDMTRDRLEADLAALPAPVVPRSAINGQTATADSTINLGAALAARGLNSGGQGASYWTARLADTARFFMCHGLPDPQRSLGLFDLNAPVWQGGTG